MIKIKDGKVRLEGCMCKPCSDISPNWDDIRAISGYILRYTPFRTRRKNYDGDRLKE